MPQQQTETCRQQQVNAPSCLMHVYDCANCKPRPLVQTNPKSGLTECDGTLWFCRFATPYSIPPMKACRQFSVQNYYCTHGGGTCPGYPILQNRLANGGFTVVAKSRTVNKQGKLESENAKVTVTCQASVNTVVDKQEETVKKLKQVGGCRLF